MFLHRSLDYLAKLGRHFIDEIDQLELFNEYSLHCTDSFEMFFISSSSFGADFSEPIRLTCTNFVDRLSFFFYYYLR